MFITTKTHAAAIREKDEVIEGLMKRLTAAEARLAPFKTYTRGKGGRFVSVRDQFESGCG